MLANKLDTAGVDFFRRDKGIAPDIGGARQVGVILERHYDEIVGPQRSRAPELRTLVRFPTVPLTGQPGFTGKTRAC